MKMFTEEQLSSLLAKAWDEGYTHRALQGQGMRFPFEADHFRDKTVSRLASADAGGFDGKGGRVDG